MSASPLFANIDPAELDDRASRLLEVFVAVAAISQGDGDGEHPPFDIVDASWGKALLTAVAAWIAHGHQDEEQRTEILTAVIDFLKAEVGMLGAAR